MGEIFMAQDTRCFRHQAWLRRDRHLNALVRQLNVVTPNYDFTSSYTTRLAWVRSCRRNHAFADGRVRSVELRRSNL